MNRLTNIVVFVVLTLAWFIVRSNINSSWLESVGFVALRSVFFAPFAILESKSMDLTLAISWMWIVSSIAIISTVCGGFFFLTPGNANRLRFRIRLRVALVALHILTLLSQIIYDMYMNHIYGKDQLPPGYSNNPYFVYGGMLLYFLLCFCVAIKDVIFLMKYKPIREQVLL